MYIVTFIQVDLDMVRARRVEAERLVRDATTHREKAEAALAEANEREKSAIRELDFARRVEETILEAATGTAAGGAAEAGRPAARDESVTATPTTPRLDEDQPVAVRPGPLSNMSTKQAIFEVLRAEPGRVWALDQLVTHMQEQGFGGTHNAVHVQLSRLIGSAEGGDLERVRTGFYRAIPKLEGAGDLPEELARDLGLQSNETHEAAHQLMQNSGQEALTG